MSQTIGVIIALFHSVVYYINENFIGWVRGIEIAVPFRLGKMTPNMFCWWCMYTEVKRLKRKKNKFNLYHLDKLKIKSKQ